VATLIDGQLNDGLHQIKWNGTGDNGFYFYRLSNGENMTGGKIILIGD